MNDHALDAVDHLERIVAALQRLHDLAPAAIEDRVRSRHTRGGRCVLAAHDADQHVDRGPGVAPCDGADLGQGFGSAHSRHSQIAMARIPASAREMR